MTRRISRKHRLWAGGLAILTLLVLAPVSGSAAPTGTKYYLFGVSTSTSTSTNTVPAGQTNQVFYVKITNTSPKQSSSNISSVAVVVPNQFTIVPPPPTIDSSSTNGDNSAATVTQGSGGTFCHQGTSQQVNVCGIAPIKSQKSVVLAIMANVTSNFPNCGESTASGPWTVRANTGTQLNGNDFDPDPIQDAVTTTITPQCAATDSSIAGQVWRDHDNDGDKDTADEAGQSGWIVRAFDGTTQAGATATTDADGNYTIGSLQSGKTYTVCEFAPAEQTGYEYRGWIQSVPGPNTPCGQMSGAEPNGISVAMPNLTTYTVADQDFLNVRTITIPGNPDTTEVDCGALPPDNTFTVGDGVNDPIGTITVDPGDCKPGEYVFETWVSGDEQNVDFHPTVPSTEKMLLIEDLEWVINGDRTQQTLYYDDFVGVGEREMLFCVVGESGSVGFPAPIAPDTAPHTSCLLNTTEDATSTGVVRHDTVYTEVDGKNTIR